MVGFNSGVSVRYKIGKLAYLADIFTRLNDRSSSPQGYYINIFTVCNKTLKKVNFFVINVCKNTTLICFQVSKILWQVPLLTLFVIMSQHLKELPINVCLYFSENKILKKGNFWIVYPFTEDISRAILMLLVKNRSLNSFAIPSYRLNMKTYHFHNFGLHLKNIYIQINNKAIKLVLIFSTAYLCRKSFSALFLIKTKERIAWIFKLYFAQRRRKNFWHGASQDLNQKHFFLVE